MAAEAIAAYYGLGPKDVGNVDRSRSATPRRRIVQDRLPSVDAPFQARENVGLLLRVVGCCHLSGL
jgi:hypothetical protein